VHGADRLSWLQGLLTNDTSTLVAGEGCYAALLNAQGRMLADLRLLELGDSLLVDVPPQATASLLATLDLYVITEDVRLDEVTATLGRVAVNGPAAHECLSAALGWTGGDRRAALAAWPPNRNARFDSSGGEVIVARARELGLRGFDVYLEPGRVDALIEALATHGAIRGTDELWEGLRIEAGIPAFGRDMDERTIPLEAGLEDEAISTTKGCYVGQEIIVRMLHRGHGRVARQLAGLLPDDGSRCRPGDALEVDGAAAGRVTSAAWSYALDRPVAIAMVQRAFTEPGTAVEIVSAEGRTTGRVAALPLVSAT
jgi:folate-binding protein YgfZ